MASDESKKTFSKPRVERTRCKPDMLYTVLVDAVAFSILAASCLAGAAKRAHILLNSSLFHEANRETMSNLILTLAYNITLQNLFVIGIFFVVVYGYFARPFLLGVISDMRWGYTQKRYQLDPDNPDCRIRHGDGWFIEDLNKEYSMVACFAYDGTFTLTDIRKDMLERKQQAK